MITLGTVTVADLESDARQRAYDMLGVNPYGLAQLAATQTPTTVPPPSRTTVPPPPMTTVPPPPTAGTGFAAFQAGDPALNVTGRPGPVVTKDGLRAYEVSYKKGQIGGGSSSMNVTLSPRAFFPGEAVRMRFKVMFEPGFPWGPAMKKSGGKIIGLWVGTGAASGGSYSTTGASYRLTWSYNGGVGPYLYPQLRQKHDKKRSGENPTWAQLDQSAEVQRASNIAAGLHVFYPRNKKDPGSWDMRLREGVWNEVEMFMRLNTPGRQDGVLELTVNGVTKRLSSVRYRYDNAKITGAKIHSFFGGGTTEYAPTHDCKAWYADFRFAPA